jgi:hypothetical protein
MEMKSSQWNMESHKSGPIQSSPRSVRSVVFGVLFGAMLAVAMTAAAHAQSDTPKPAEKMDHSAAQAVAPKAPPTEAQKAFAILKSLAGDWQGAVTMVPPMNGVGNANIDVSLRVTSRGNSIVHEMQASNTPFDYTKEDHPVTMFYVDGEQLNLVHYCDAGNRPHMIARPSADGKTVEFDFVDVSGPTKFGNMYHAVFTVIDANHHIEEWTFKIPTGLMKGRSDLYRKTAASASNGK